MRKIRFKLIELKIISIVASCSSLSQASVILGIAQANISKYLSDFEVRTGLKVFERTTRRVTLTAFGEALLPEVDHYLNQTDELDTFITDYKNEKRGKITLYAPTGIVMFLAQKVIPHLQDCGEISIALRTSNLKCNEFYDGLAFPDDADVLLTYARPKDESLVANTISSFVVSAYASPDYLAQHPIDTPEQLVNHTCILMQSMLIDETNIWHFTSGRDGETHQYKVAGNYICDNIHAATELARHGLGIVFVPRQSIRNDLAEGGLVPCFKQDAKWSLDLIAIYKKREYQPYRVKYVLDQILDIVDKYIRSVS
jgi:DNA-binding transcriptional LysR family regulator